MKYVVIIGDGMADRPLRELGGKTPLQYARTDNMDRLASKGIIGSAYTIPEGMHPGSDIANLSILGYNPAEYYSGRAPLEAASIGVSLTDTDVAYRCNLVTLKFNRDRTKAVMEDYSSGHITTEESRELMQEIGRELGSDQIRFYPGVSYRHLMVWADGSSAMECAPPHDILGKDIIDYLPVGQNEALLRQLMLDSVDLLEGHPVNKERVRNGLNPANSIWFWGQGKRPSIPSFEQKYGLKGSLVSAVDLTKGLGIYAGFEILEVPGMTGYIDTNYQGKADEALRSLERADLVYIHVEAPDEAGHSGKCRDKVKAIEDFDRIVVGTVMEGVKRFGDHRILVMPDHPTPIELRTHSADPVPFVIYDSRSQRPEQDAVYDESIIARDGVMVVKDGYTLMDYFIHEK
ncbi:MAG: cofactor-independent phosphoglycerate mutase [Thermodesulfovibrionales bacterium]